MQASHSMARNPVLRDTPPAAKNSLGTDTPVPEKFRPARDACRPELRLGRMAWPREFSVRETRLARRRPMLQWRIHAIGA
jgi:hypothetical protein